MKKLFAFFTTLTPCEGVYLTYSWHAPLNEASCAAAEGANHKLETTSSRATANTAWA